MSSYDGVVNRVVVSQLDLDPLAQRWEHLCEYDLFVPRWATSALADGSFALEKEIKRKIPNMKLLKSYHGKRLKHFKTGVKYSFSVGSL